jgi:hypothetical protein
MLASQASDGQLLDFGQPSIPVSQCRAHILDPIKYLDRGDLDDRRVSAASPLEPEIQGAGPARRVIDRHLGCGHPSPVDCGTGDRLLGPKVNDVSWICCSGRSLRVCMQHRTDRMSDASPHGHRACDPAPELHRADGRLGHASRHGDVELSQSLASPRIAEGATQRAGKLSATVISGDLGLGAASGSQSVGHDE